MNHKCYIINNIHELQVLNRYILYLILPAAAYITSMECYIINNMHELQVLDRYLLYLILPAAAQITFMSYKVKTLELYFMHCDFSLSACKQLKDMYLYVQDY